ncbi:MAG: rhamnulokinase [candidate division KSB1 bacterium]|nr:rhamnulokinase [candidate division KSB1 bacterium]MDZ7367795.1 rhamnulokinase [candidate division KSB1 bacterium]MDZ7406614.1 rhamnulokinase [candidate division KSB1 bacterium]
MTYLAFDLGAESGRAMVGHIENGRIALRELHRFPNRMVPLHGHLYWDLLHLFAEIQHALHLAGREKIPLAGIGVDSWGVDFGLLDRDGHLLANPITYRDHRTEGMIEKVLAKMPAAEIYRHTGIQFSPINTLYQLYALAESASPLLQIAQRLLFIPDLVNFMLTGRQVSEFTFATTSQLFNPQTRAWADPIFTRLGLPRHLMAGIVEPGTVIGALRHELASGSGLGEVPVIAVGCHDTASAVAAVPAVSGTFAIPPQSAIPNPPSSWAYLSSGTWSLLGVETAAPVINERALQMNFTNEGGVAGTIRLLKNIMGLWLLQACRQQWRREGREYDYAELTALAGAAAPFRCFVNPDAPVFLNPDNMPQAIAGFCRQTRQPLPHSDGELVRCILESLALQYRRVLEMAEALQGKKVEALHIVGGGSQNALLNQFTADAIGKPVLAGPVEATALGNIAVQAMATGEFGNLGQARQAIKNSFAIQEFQPRDSARWDEAYQRFVELLKNFSNG